LKCPYCGREIWNIECPKCGNRWFTKSVAKYVSCSRCHTKFKRPVDRIGHSHSHVLEGAQGGL